MVDQTENQLMAEERLSIDRQKSKIHVGGVVIKKESYAVNREITGIYTKSSIPYDPNSGDYESKWILSVKDDGKNQIGLILFDISTL